MTIAERINDARKSEFEKEFDLDTFNAFIEEHVSKNHHVTIGLEGERCFDTYLHNKQQYRDWESDSKWLAFAEGHRCYVWSTNCQIPQKFVKDVQKHLHGQGLRTTLKGACGYETYDVMEVTL
jgi:hypothetical protein